MWAHKNVSNKLAQMLLSDVQIYSQKLSNKRNAFLCQSPLTTLFFAQITQQRKCHQQLCPLGGRRAGQGHRTVLRGSLGSSHPVSYCKRTAEGKSSTGMLQELGSTQRNCPPSTLGTTQTHLLLSPSKEALPVAALTVSSYLNVMWTCAWDCTSCLSSQV